MDKKKIVKNQPPEDLRGFEEFIDSQPDDTSFLPKQPKKDTTTTFEHFTFLTNDATRLKKLKDLLMEKMPFAAKYEQGENLIKDQSEQNATIKKHIFEMCNKPESPYRRSLKDIFDSFFEPPKT